MEPDWKCKNNHADTSWKEDLSIDATFDPSLFSWDTSFQQLFVFNILYILEWWSDDITSNSLFWNYHLKNFLVISERSDHSTLSDDPNIALKLFRSLFLCHFPDTIFSTVVIWYRDGPEYDSSRENTSTRGVTWSFGQLDTSRFSKDNLLRG